MLASYHIEYQPTTFDFLTWLVCVKTCGATSMNFYGKHFKPKANFPDEIAESRLEKLLKPLAELAELPMVDPEEKGAMCSHFLKAVHVAWRENSKIWKLPYEKKHDHITVTRRKSFRNNHRDSDWPEWEKFISWAENRGEKVVVLDDDEKPIPPKERWDLYQCKMNLFVVSGPMNMCVFSDAPFLAFKWPGNEHDVYLQMVHHWIYPNSQLPWMHQRQRFVWEPDKFQTLVRYYERATSGDH